MLLQVDGSITISNSDYVSPLDPRCHVKFNNVQIWRQEPSHRVCKPAYLGLSQARINWEGCARKGIWCKNGGDGRDGAPISLDWVAVHPDCWCVCLCFLILHQKTQIVPDKVQRAVKWLWWRQEILADKQNYLHSVAVLSVSHFTLLYS